MAGRLQFGPDGYLYIGTGDGGQANDPWDNAENRGVLLGKMLRIAVQGQDSYAIPHDNPFIEQNDVRAEIWAYGLRNPWRFSFDRGTGDLYIADVGQNQWEEIDFQPAESVGGEHYGWDTTEGTHCFEPASGCDASAITLPVAEYGHDQGCSVTGGYVYRGATTPSWMASIFTQIFAVATFGRYGKGMTVFGRTKSCSTVIIASPHLVKMRPVNCMFWTSVAVSTACKQPLISEPGFLPFPGDWIIVISCPTLFGCTN